MLSARDISGPGRERPVLDLLTDLNAWAALASLTALEIVLGVDNVVFISILVGRLDPRPRRDRAAGRPWARARLPHRAAVRADLAARPVRHRVHGVGQSVLLARPDPDRRRALPHRQGDPRDACARSTSPTRTRSRRRRRRRAAASMGLVIVQLVVDRSRVLDQFHRHRDRHVARHPHHDRRGADRGRRHVCGVGAGGAVRRQPPDHQDAGARIPPADRRRAGRRRLRLPHPARLHLLRHGVRRRGRGLQRAGRPQARRHPRKRS